MSDTHSADPSDGGGEFAPTDPRSGGQVASGPLGANIVHLTVAQAASNICMMLTNLALVRFSKPMDPDDAENRANYLVGDGVVVLEAMLSRDGRTVLLQTTDRTPGESYSI